MCTFRASCCSAHLSRAQVPLFGTEKKRWGGSKGGEIKGGGSKGGGSKGGPPALVGTREYEQSDQNR